MKRALILRLGLVILLALLVSPGCHKKAKYTGDSSTPAAQPTGGGAPATPGGGGGSLVSPGAGGAVMQVRSAFERQRAAQELHQLALFYQGYEVDHDGQPPANLEQLLGHIRNEHPKLVDGLKKGWYVVYWNVRPNNLPAGAANTILAYDEDAPKKGGWVVMADYSQARMMTPQEFAAAPKAGP